MHYQWRKVSSLLADGLGHDYALIIKANYQSIPQKSLLIIAGCYMWGTKAGAEAVTEPRILNEVARETGNSSNVAFIVKTRVVNDSPIGPEIEIENRRYVHALKAKQVTQQTSKIA